MDLETDVLETKCGIQNVTTYPRTFDWSRMQGCDPAILRITRSFCMTEKCHCPDVVNVKSMRERRYLRRNRVLGSEEWQGVCTKDQAKVKNQDSAHAL